MFCCFRHQIQHYTGQLAKDSAKHLKDLNGAVRQGRSGTATSEQRQRRLQFESLQDDFTKALNSFQQVGLALAVIAEHQQPRRIQLQMQLRIVAKTAQLQAVEKDGGRATQQLT